MKDMRAAIAERASRNLKVDYAIALVLFVAGALRFLVSPSDGSDVNGAVFGLVVAAAGLVWLIVARIRIWHARS